jgi:hypothetical protein
MTYSSPDSVVDQIRRTGSYIGNGTSQAIAIGWQPKYIHIMNTSGAPAGRRGGFKTDTMAGNNMIQHDGSTATGVTITSTGFSIDGSAMVNFSADPYTWIAVR